VAPPLKHLAQFMAQPRLRLAFVLATGRGMFWGTFTIYTPLYAVATGLGAEAGGLLVSVGNGFMLLMPLWGWTARRYGIRRVSLVSFPLTAIAMTAAGWLAFWPSPWPWVGAAAAVCAAGTMSIADGYGNALFFRACKPSQRTAMTPIFSAQRDLANIGHAGLFAILLSFFPIQAVYITLGLVLFGMTLLATLINKRL
jgi:MFS family permease